MVPLTPFSLYTDASLWGWGGGQHWGQWKGEDNGQ